MFSLSCNLNNLEIAFQMFQFSFPLPDVLQVSWTSSPIFSGHLVELMMGVDIKKSGEHQVGDNDFLIGPKNGERLWPLDGTMSQEEKRGVLLFPLLQAFRETHICTGLKLNHLSPDSVLCHPLLVRGDF